MPLTLIVIPSALLGAEYSENILASGQDLEREGQCSVSLIYDVSSHPCYPKHHNCMTEPIFGPLANFRLWTECLCHPQIHMLKP